MKISSLLLALAALGATAPETPHGTIVASNMRDNTATIIDAASGKVLATLSTGEAPHEVATTHDGKFAVVSNYGTREHPGNSITVIDLAKLAVGRTIDLGDYRRPHGMAFFPGDTVLAVTSEVSRAVLLVDFRDGHVIGTVPTNGRASHMLAKPSPGPTGNAAPICCASPRALNAASMSPLAPKCTALPRSSQWCNGDGCEPINWMARSTTASARGISAFQRWMYAR